MTNFVELWVYLSASPLLWLTATLIAYAAADTISAASSAVLLGKLFGLDRGAMLALAPKSSTAAIAMGIAEKTGATLPYCCLRHSD